MLFRSGGEKRRDSLIGFALGVDAQVAGQGGRAREGLAAVRTQVRLLSGVGALVVLQVLQLRVGLATLVAGVGPVALVVAPVFPGRESKTETWAMRSDGPGWMEGRGLGLAA